MAALVTEPANLDAYEILAPHAGLNLVTPIFKAHILHIAVATLSLRVLQRVCQDIHLACNPITALHHTLLHIACLPGMDEEINLFSPKIHASIHALRSLRSSSKRLHLWPHEPPRKHRWSKNAVFPPARSLESLESQTTIVSFLLRNSHQDITKQDIHGNTALHYLSGQRRLNEPLISVLRLEPGGEETWMRSENRWGFTPRELYEEGKDICEDLVHGAGTRCMPFWSDPMGTWTFDGKYNDEYAEVERKNEMT